MRIRVLVFLTTFSLAFSGCTGFDGSSKSDSVTDGESVSESVSEVAFYDVGFTDFDHFINSSLFAEHTGSGMLEKQNSVTGAKFIVNAVLGKSSIHSVVSSDEETAVVEYSFPNFSKSMEMVVEENPSIKDEYVNLVSLGVSEYELNSFLVSAIASGIANGKAPLDTKEVEIPLVGDSLESDSFLVSELEPFVFQAVNSIKTLLTKQESNIGENSSLFSKIGLNDAKVVRMEDDGEHFKAVLSVQELCVGDAALEALASMNVVNSDISVQEDAKVVYLKYSLSSLDSKKHSVKSNFIAMDKLYRKVVSNGIKDLAFTDSGVIDPSVANKVNLVAVLVVPGDTEEIYWRDGKYYLSLPLTVTDDSPLDSVESEESDDSIEEEGAVAGET